MSLTDFKILDYNKVLKSYDLIKSYIFRTAIVSNKKINQLLNAEIFFKMENQQITLSFKARGAFNAILSYQEKNGFLPKKIVVQSSGNHAQAVAYVAKNLGLEVLVYMASNVSPFKIDKVKELGAKVVICQERSEANKLAQEKQSEGYFFIHPSDNDEVILGQATCALEIFDQVQDLSAIFAPCGGGGLLAGCYLSALAKSPKTKVFGCEPEMANDAFLSLKNNKIYSFTTSPNTIADGARTLAVSNRCFNYLKKITEILEISEEKIKFWQEFLSNNLGEAIEPTSALTIAGIEKYLQQNPQESGKKYCAIITGGNLY